MQPGWKMTLQVMWAGNIFFPPLLSQVNSMDFKRMLWIQRMALLRTIKEHGWLIMYGRCGGHSHSCMHLSMWSFLYSSYESAAPFKTHFWGKSQRYRTPIHIHYVVPHVCSGTVCHLIFFFMRFVRSRVHIIVWVQMLHVPSVNQWNNYKRNETEV